MSNEQPDAPTRLEELQDAAWKAAAAHRQLVSKRDEEIYSRVNDFKTAVTAEVGVKYNAEIARLLKARLEAEATELAERDCAAIATASGGDSRLAVGTKAYEWRRFPEYGHRRLDPKDYSLTGRVGVVEVWTSKSVCPENIKYSKPSVGSIVIRLLNAKGELTKRFDRSPGNWAAQGEKPK